MYAVGRIQPADHATAPQDRERLACRDPFNVIARVTTELSDANGFHTVDSRPNREVNIDSVLTAKTTPVDYFLNH